MVRASRQKQSKSRLVIAVIAAVFAFTLVRSLFLPAQLAHTPYRDATVGADILAVFFVDISAAAWVAGILASVLAFVIAMRGRASHT